MRQGSNPRRSRGRGPRKPHNPSRPQNFDNSGSERVRGNAYQVMEKYLAMARDASAAGDRIAMENYLQHAEHYYRMLNANGDANRQRPPMRNDGQGQGGPGGYGQDGNQQGNQGQGGNGPSGNGFDGRSDDQSQHDGTQPQNQSPDQANVVPDPTDESDT
jgi:hypothetical protein